MSAIASFYLIDVANLDELVRQAGIVVKKSLFSKKVTDNYYDYLASNASTLRELDASGHLLVNLFVFWEEEKNIDLLKNEYEAVTNTLSQKRDCAHFIFTHRQKTDFISRLEPANYSLDELRQFNQDFSEDGDEETAQYSLDSIRIFHDNLNQLQNDSQLMLLIIG